jgi:cobalt-zinc-cadmium efflux system protein
LLGSWRLVKEATGVLLEMVPPHVDMAGVLKDLRSIPNVHNVHDLHVWTLTSGFVALSGHAVLDDPIHHQRVLDEIRDRMELRGIGHVTFQLEPERLHQIAPRDQTGDGVR